MKIRSHICFLAIAGLFIIPFNLQAQSALQQLEQAAGRSVSSVYVPAVSAPTRVGSSAASSSKSVLPSTGSSVSDVVAGAIIQGLLNNILNPAPAKTQAEIEAEQKERERLALEEAMRRQAEEARKQALHEELLNASKDIDGSPDLDFKNLDGDAERMRKEAADQFEPDGNGSSSGKTTGGTTFFGEGLSDAEIRVLIEPSGDPVYSDVQKAVELADEYIKNEKVEEKNINKTPDCAALAEKLERYRRDMIRFAEWNKGTLAELKKWEEQNDEAFWNAVTDAADAAYGQFLDYLVDTRESAAAIRKVLDANEGKYLTGGVFSPAEIVQYRKLLDQRITTCNITTAAKNLMEPWEYVNLAKNLIHGTADKLKATDEEYKTLVSKLKEKDMLSTTPWVDAGQFLAGKFIDNFLGEPKAIINPNKFVKGAIKIPYVNIAQLVVDEAYNGYDMYLSYKNVVTLREADGKATEAINKIYADMNEIKVQLAGCPASK